MERRGLVGELDARLERVVGQLFADLVEDLVAVVRLEQRSKGVLVRHRKARYAQGRETAGALSLWQTGLLGQAQLRSDIFSLVSVIAVLEKAVITQKQLRRPWWD